MNQIMRYKIIDIWSSYGKTGLSTVECQTKVSCIGDTGAHRLSVLSRDESIEAFSGGLLLSTLQLSSKTTWKRAQSLESLIHLEPNSVPYWHRFAIILIVKLFRSENFFLTIAQKCLPFSKWIVKFKAAIDIRYSLLKCSFHINMF